MGKVAASRTTCHCITRFFRPDSGIDIIKFQARGLQERELEAYANGRNLANHLKKRTLKGYQYLLERLPSSGIHRLGELTRENVQRHIRERREQDGICAATAKRIHAAVLSFASWLEQNNEIPLDQLLSLRTIRVKQPTLPPPRFLTREEYVRLLVAARSHRPMLGLAVSIAVHTGLRMNELRCLHHEEIIHDATEPYVRVARDNVREVKTKRPRTPPISMGFAAELRRQCVGQPRTGPIFPAGAGRVAARKSSSPYVGHHALEDWMAHAREAAGLGPDVTFITLRHTYASWLIQGGVSIAKVAGWCGHNVSVCWKHYAGLVPGGDKDVEKGFAPKTPPHPGVPRRGVFVIEDDPNDPVCHCGIEESKHNGYEGHPFVAMRDGRPTPYEVDKPASIPASSVGDGPQSGNPPRST